MHDLRLFVTLWPSFSHFPEFATSDLLAGIRMNSAQISNPMLEEELVRLKTLLVTVPLYFDVKGWQLRVEEVSIASDGAFPHDAHLRLRLNHPVKLPIDLEIEPFFVLFKGGEDAARLRAISDDGYWLTFYPGKKFGPRFEIFVGDSLTIRHPGFSLLGPQFTPAEVTKIAQVKAAGFTRYFLSFVHSQRDIDEFRERVGKDTEIYIKIEDPKGLRYVAREFRPQPGVHLVAAMGDLYVEVDRPHDILAAVELIVKKDPEACVGSRMLLSVIPKKTPENPDPKDPDVPSAADFMQLAWLHSIGYRTFMLCDELCLKGPLLTHAVHAFDAFHDTRRGGPAILPARPATPVVSHLDFSLNPFQNLFQIQQAARQKYDGLMGRSPKPDPPPGD